MINVPLDMLIFFMYKMRMDLLENSLDTHIQYADVDFDTFIMELNNCFERYKAAGATELNIVHGLRNNSNNIIYGFECVQLNEELPFLVECLEDNTTIIGICRKDDYNKLGNLRSKLAL